MDQVTQFTMLYFYPPIGPVMFLNIFFVKKKKIEHFFQSRHFTRKLPRDLLILELDIVHTMNFR